MGSWPDSLPSYPCVRVYSLLQLPWITWKRCGRHTNGVKWLSALGGLHTVDCWLIQANCNRLQLFWLRETSSGTFCEGVSDVGRNVISNTRNVSSEEQHRHMVPTKHEWCFQLALSFVALSVFAVAVLCLYNDIILHPSNKENSPCNVML